MDDCANILQWNYTSHEVHDQCGGRWHSLSKTADEAYNLIEEIALNNYEWSNERGQPKRVGGKFDVDTLTLLTAKMDLMTQRLDHLNVNAVDACPLSLTCDRYGSFNHVTMHCQIGNLFVSSSSEPVAYVNNFQPMPTNNPYSNTYNPSWKHHPNLSYRNESLPFSQANARQPLGFQGVTSLHLLHKSLTLSLCWKVCF